MTHINVNYWTRTTYLIHLTEREPLILSTYLVLNNYKFIITAIEVQGRLDFHQSLYLFRITGVQIITMHGCFLSCTEDSWRKIIFTCWATILQLRLNSDNAPEYLIWVKVGPKHSFVVCVMHNVTWTTIEINRAVSFQNCNCTQLSMELQMMICSYLESWKSLLCCPSFRDTQCQEGLSSLFRGWYQKFAL